MIKKIAPYTSALLVIITCTMFGLYNYLHYSVVPTYEQKLLAMTHNRTDEINTYLNEQEKNAVQLSQESIIINAFKKTTSELTTLISAQKKNMGFKNVLLIDKSGTIIFSTTDKNIVGININQPLYTNSSLGKSYERASMTLTNDFSNFNFNELLQEPAIFITIPIIKEKKFLGALTYQLNQEKIYLVTHQYIGLEKTGEIVLAKKENSYALFLAPTRNDPDLAFKKRALSTDQPLAIQACILGRKGVGTAVDYRGKTVVGAWQFIPKLDWGIMIKIDKDEIIQPLSTLYTIFLLCLILLLTSAFITMYLFFPLLKHKSKTISNSFPCNKIPPLFKNPLFIALLITCGITTKNIILCKKNRLTTLEKAKDKAIKNITKNSEIVEAILEKIAFVGQSIANDLQTNYLKKDDIPTRIKRDTAENSIITDITVNFARDMHDKTIKNEATWTVNPPKDNNAAQQTATYTCTFFTKENKPNGIIAITFCLKNIIDTSEYSGIGQTGYSIIMANNGAFIFHPLTSLVKTETTLLQYAQAKGNEELAAIAQKIGGGKPVTASYSSESTKERLWICTQPLHINGWVVGTIFSQDEVSVPSEVTRHYYFWILIWITITLLLLFALLWRRALCSLISCIVITNILLILALITAWYIIKQTTTVNRESRTIITDQSNLNKFLNDLNEEAKRKHEAAPINIPCGILLYSLSISGPDNITISGYLWNKYNTELHTNIVRGMDLPQATRMIYGTPLLSQAGNEETSTWNIQGVLFQEQHYAKYPFDQQHIRIFLEHKDIEKNIILTPDLISYKKISPEATPGLDKDFSLAGFTIEQTFFEYHKIDPSTNFGFKEYGKVTDNYQLIYNAIMNRNLLNPFIIYLLPLLVILFSLFTMLLVIGKNSAPLSILGGYTGLFFALILLQRTLREQHPAGGTLYMEYAFFYTYITIILLIMHTIMMYYYKNGHAYQNRSLYLMRILFWPFQFIAWLITTLIIFY